MSSDRLRVLVTGGAGFIGSHVCEAYLAEGHEVWALDNLSSGKRENVPSDAHFIEADIEDPSVGDLFAEVGFDVVNHHAAQIDVRISVEDPQRDARTNILGLLNLTEAALATGTRRFIYVSSGGVVYGEPEVRPTPEMTAKNPMSPYGVSKLTGEHYLGYYRQVHGLEYVALRYSNVYGPRQDPHGEAGVVAIFCNRLLSGQALTIFGDGEQSRDYVFVKDVARANVVATEIVLDGEGIDSVAFNVGTGVGTSVNQLASVLEEGAGVTVERDFQPERPGELRHSVLATGKLEGRGWERSRTLSEGLAETYRYIERHAAVTGGAS